MLLNRTRDLRDQVVVITGSAGGFGNALAHELATRGARIALIARKPEAAQAQALGLPNPNSARGWCADVTDLRQLEAVMGDIADHFGRIDVVVANAGLDLTGSVASQSEADFAQIIDVNLVGVWRTFKAALPYLEPDSYLLAVASMATFVHFPMQAAYCASKAGLFAMVNSLRLEVRHQGIKVGSIHPTFFDTPLMDKLLADPVGQAIWGGNGPGIWQLVPIEQVVADTVAGIERRAELLVSPGRMQVLALTSALWRKPIEWIGFRDKEIARAARLAVK
ncbi:SDR family NAD(P)-dependent oxidoreductase [Nocardia sp. NBC_01388]|uniref:SDR family NAD(P)-dependent oxidoreductase n=1 Tax=Nocardia sp. NBC_01388 TaxID=2903596 RepID=UPI00325069A7